MVCWGLWWEAGGTQNLSQQRGTSLPFLDVLKSRSPTSHGSCLFSSAHKHDAQTLCEFNPLPEVLAVGLRTHILPRQTLCRWPVAFPS